MKPVASPSAAEAPAGRGLSPVRTLLDNGVVVVTKQTRKTPAVSINLSMRNGSACDPAGRGGAMHLLGRVIDRGTATRSAHDIADALDTRGISLNIGVSRHVCSFVCTCLAEDFEPVLALIADILMSPSFPATELATRKGEVVTAIRQDQDNPYVTAFDGLLSLLYGPDHPYGRAVKGSIDAVEHITRDELVALHAKWFAPSQLTAAIVGDVEPHRAIEAAAAAFGTWNRPVPPQIALPAPVPAASRRQIVETMMNKVQADIAYGFTAVTRADPDYYACHLMNHALGQYALGGRLGDSIRERQGMAYYVSSALDANVVAGPLTIRAGVAPANVDRTIQSIDEELARLREEGLTVKELDESRQYLIGSLPRSLETNAGIAGFLQSVEFFGLGLDYDLRLPALLQAVTLDAVHQMARRIVDPARATIVVAGPYEARA